MTRIVAGTFETEEAAHHVVDELRHAGFEPRDVDEFVVNPPGRHHRLPMGGDETADAEAKGGETGALTGAVVGSAVGVVAGLAAAPILGPAAIPGGLAAGAYAGSLAGAVNKMGDQPAPMLRPPGWLVAVHANFDQDESAAVDIMHEAGATLVERADGVWRDGRWVDFDPVKPPLVVEQRAA